MEWLENNAYSRQLNRSGMRGCCGVYAFFAQVVCGLWYYYGKGAGDVES